MIGALHANSSATACVVASTASLPPPTITAWSRAAVLTRWLLSRMSSLGIASSEMPRRRRSKSVTGTSGVPGASPDRSAALPSGPINWIVELLVEQRFGTPRFTREHHQPLRDHTQTIATDLFDRGASAVRFPSRLDGNPCIAYFEKRGNVSAAGDPIPLTDPPPEALTTVAATWGSCSSPRQPRQLSSMCGVI
jgi:hypothetical protein